MGLTPKQLLAEPSHLLSYLRILPPQHVCAGNMIDHMDCLVTRFLRAHGHDAGVSVNHGFLMRANGTPGEEFPVGPVVARTIEMLIASDDDYINTTAKAALRTLRRAIREERV